MATSTRAITRAGGVGAKGAASVATVAPLALNASHVAEAIRRIEQELAFVGLTERFDESICLFHARFGGRPVPAQFVNVRPMVNTTSTVSSAAAWARAGGGGGGRAAKAAAAWVDDPWDTAVHAAARARFERDLQAVRGNRSTVTDTATDTTCY